MGSIQQFLVIGGIMLLSYLSLTFYRSSGNQTSTMIENETIITATSVGQSIIDEISMKAFDESTVNNFRLTTSQLTPVASLGIDASEDNVKKYDDIDDYRNYKRIDYLPRLGMFTTFVCVKYANTATLDSIQTPTFLKRIDVSVVINSGMKDTVKLNHYISY
jgi:ABC-type antimicrobial peptide transport system permease subunit